jgi:hypothetical protein
LIGFEDPVITVEEILSKPTERASTAREYPHLRETPGNSKEGVTLYASSPISVYATPNEVNWDRLVVKIVDLGSG